MNLEEAEEKIEELNEKVEELEQSLIESQEESSGYCDEISEITEEGMDRKEQSELAEKSFYDGRNSDLTVSPLKAWLNYKIGEGL